MNVGGLREFITTWLQRIPRLVTGGIVENRLIERDDSVSVRFYCGTHLYELRGNPHNMVATAWPLTSDGTPQTGGTEIFSGPLDEEELTKLTYAILNTEVVPFGELKVPQKQAVTAGSLP